MPGKVNCGLRIFFFRDLVRCRLKRLVEFDFTTPYGLRIEVSVSL